MPLGDPRSRSSAMAASSTKLLGATANANVSSCSSVAKLGLCRFTVAASDGVCVCSLSSGSRSYESRSQATRQDERSALELEPLELALESCFCSLGCDRERLPLQDSHGASY